MGDCNKDKDEGEMMLREMKTRTRRTRTEDKTEDSKDNVG